MGDTLVKNNLVPKESKDFLIDPDNDVYYEINIVRVDQTLANTSKTKRQTAKFKTSHDIFMKIKEQFGLVPNWQIWLQDKDAEGKPIQGKGKWVSASQAN